MTWWLPIASERISANARLHFQQRNRMTKALIYEVGWLVKQHNIPNLDRRCEIQLVWVVNDRRRRDNDNPDPTLKALADGLVRARVLTDDTPDLVTKCRTDIRHKDTTDLRVGMWLRVTKLADDITQTNLITGVK